MALSNIRRTTFAIVISLCLVQNILAQADSTSNVKSAASILAAASITAPFPKGTDSPFSGSITTMTYKSLSSDNEIMPVIALQWWVSPNLALSNTTGIQRHDSRYVKLQRFGIRFLPASMAIGAATPELLLLQGKFKGLPEYAIRWNEFQWRYTLNREKLGLAVGFVHLSQIILPSPNWSAGHVADRLEGSTNGILAAGNYAVMEWIKLSLRVVATPNLFSFTIQIDAVL